MDKSNKLDKIFKKIKPKLFSLIRKGYYDKLTTKEWSFVYARLSAILRKLDAPYNYLQKNGIEIDAVSKRYVIVDDAHSGYVSYTRYLAGSISYSLTAPIPCFFLNVPFFSDLSHYYYKNSNNQTEMAYINTTYGIERAKTDIWYDKRNRTFYGFKYEYPVYTGYKRAPRFWRDPGATDSFGFEFELKFPSYEHKISFATEIYAKHKPCICEKDGSLDGGIEDGPSLELITPPLSYQDSLQLGGDLLNLVNKYKGEVPNDWYAWHITINLMGADDPTQAGERFMRIINLRSLRDFWQKVARRKSEINPETGKNYCKFEQRSVMMDIEVWRDRWAERPINHYWATYLRTNGRSIELRICKSVVDFNEFSTILDIINTTWQYAKSNTPFGNKHFISYLTQHVNPTTVSYINHVRNHS